jgi:hypothetical protein
VLGKNWPPLLSHLAGIVGLLKWCHNSSVPWITVAQTCGSLFGSNSTAPSTATSPFPQLHMRKSKHALILGCHSASFRLGPLAA